MQGMSVPFLRSFTLQLSWLMLWAILLGCDDFQSKQAMDSGRRHRRPSVADMADVAGRLKAVAEHMEVRWLGRQGGVRLQTEFKAGMVASVPLTCSMQISPSCWTSAITALHSCPSTDSRPHLRQELEGGITEAALEAPAGAALVQECVQLYNRLAALTRLDDPKLLLAVSGRAEGGR